MSRWRRRAGLQELTPSHKIEAGGNGRITHVGIRIGLASSGLSAGLRHENGQILQQREKERKKNGES